METLQFDLKIENTQIRNTCSIELLGTAYKEQVLKFFKIQGTSTQVLKIKEQSTKFGKQYKKI